MKTLAQLRQYPRDYFDVDAEELPDTLLDSWLYEGDVRIFEQMRRWPFYEAVFTLPITSNTSSYDLAALVPTLDRVSWVAGDDGIINEIGTTLGIRRHERYGATTTPSARPASYSLYGNVLRIWPPPDVDYSLSIGGYRKRVNWIAQGPAGVPDFPDEFEPALISWMMHMAYMHQDDPEMADRQRERFEEILGRLTGGEGQGGTGELIIGGQGQSYQEMPRLRYDAWWG